MQSVGGALSSAGLQMLSQLTQVQGREEQTESPQERAREARQGEESGNAQILQLNLARGLGGLIDTLA